VLRGLLLGVAYGATAGAALYALDGRFDVTVSSLGSWASTGAALGGVIGLLSGTVVGLVGAALAACLGDRQPDSSRVAAAASLLMLALVTTVIFAVGDPRAGSSVLLFGVLPVGLTVGSLVICPLKSVYGEAPHRDHPLFEP
jgi:hypothetical protein